MPLWRCAWRVRTQVSTKRERVVKQVFLLFLILDDEIRVRVRWFSRFNFNFIDFLAQPGAHFIVCSYFSLRMDPSQGMNELIYKVITSYFSFMLQEHPYNQNPQNKAATIDINFNSSSTLWLKVQPPNISSPPGKSASRKRANFSSTSTTISINLHRELSLAGRSDDSRGNTPPHILD